MNDVRINDLVAICRALNERFPDGCDIFQRVSRLCEESGELASAVNHLEGMGVKQQKHGAPDYANLVKEIQDVMRCAMGIALHYGVEEEVMREIARAALGIFLRSISSLKIHSVG